MSNLISSVALVPDTCAYMATISSGKTLEYWCLAISYGAITSAAWRDLVARNTDQEMQAIHASHRFAEGYQHALDLAARRALELGATESSQSNRAGAVASTPRLSLRKTAP